MSGYVFSGQGAQKKGMGAGLFEQYPELIKQADEILGYSIEELCLTDPENRLNHTQYTQPAVFIVNALTFLEYQKKNEIEPEFYAGHSLGEYNALFAAGVFDWQTGLKLVKKRGELMGKTSDTGMAAIMGISCEKVLEILDNNKLHTVDIANYNSPEQTVISAPKNVIHEIGHYFEELEARYVILNVSAAFHSRYMDDARNEFAPYIEEVEFKQPKIPVIANLTARPYKYTKMKETLLEQINHSVQWTDSIRYMMGKGVDDIISVGFGTSARSLVRQIKKLAEPLIVEEEDEVAEDTAVTKKILNEITAKSLGSSMFKEKFGLEYAYVTGSMYHAISGVELVSTMSNKGFLSFYGTGGVSLQQAGKDIDEIKSRLMPGKVFGVNMLCQNDNRQNEKELVDLLLEKKVNIIEVSAALQITEELVRYRVKGLYKDRDNRVYSVNKVFAKISRPEIAKLFLDSPQKEHIERLRQRGEITAEEALLASSISMADAITVEGDSGGHTDGASLISVLPTIIRMRERLQVENNSWQHVYIGAAGGIGTPESAATAFLLGAEYIQTGSINQCTVEAATSNVVKDMLQNMNVQDTDYTPCGDLFEFGGKIQVLKKGVFFPFRAKKLYELYSLNNSIDEIPVVTRKQLEDKYFKRTIEVLQQEVAQYYESKGIDLKEMTEKKQMAAIFKWYFAYSTRLALEGNEENQVNFQVHCGPALGAFNQWVKGTQLEDWRGRHVDEIGEYLLECTASYITDWIHKMEK